MNARTTRTTVYLLAGAFWLVADGTAKGYPPVYVTVVSHNEEGGAGRPVYTADQTYYLQNRNLVKLLAETITSRGATYNFQSDWNYLKAVAMFDVGSVTTNTNGKNIVRWMKEDLGVEIDPHAHESQYNYADVAYLIEQLGVTTSKNVGGFLYDPPDNPQGWEQHSGGIYGWIYPSYFWRADHLWGAATYLHQGNDDVSSGIWRPKDRYNFYVNDPNQRLLYIGGGCGGPPGLMQLLDDIQAGRVPADGFYTANLFMVQDLITPPSIAALGAFIDSLAPYVADGRVRWSTLSQTAQTWRTPYGARSFRYNCAAATTYTTETIETWVTAPDGNQLYTRVIQPTPSLYPGQRFPALIAITGGTGPGAPLADNPGYKSLAAGGFVVVVFNPEGRGSGQPGNLLSQGTENCNGYVHQDDLKAIVEYTAAKTNVDASNIGVETASFGIAIGAGALGRYPNLPVKYLVDQEGPHDSRVITFYDLGSERAVCGHWSTVTDSSPANVAWWVEREAVQHIGNYPGMYLRMQAEIDHAQGTGYFRHTIEMINAATQPVYGGTGSACWTRVNGTDVGNPINTVYPFSDPNQYPTWVTGKLADHPGLNLNYDREMSALTCPAPIPTVSQWGLVTLTLLLMTAATIVIRQTRREQASPLVQTYCVVLIALMTAPAPAQAAQNPAGDGFVLVTERAGTTVAKIDVDTDQIIGRATVGNQPSDLAADHLRRWVYVAANLDHKIVAMKADTLETADLNIPGLGKLPIGVEITPDGGTLLVTTRGSDGIISADDRLDVIRLNASSWPPTGSLIASISTGLHPIGACLARDGRHAVITVRNQPAILIVDLQTNQIVGQAQNLPLDAEPEGCDAHPTANVVYVTLHGPASTVEVFDLDTLTHVTHVPIVHTPPARPSTGVFTPDGGRFYVSGQTVNKIFLFETSDPLNPVQNMAVQLPVGQQPHFIVYLPGDRAYVANTNNEQPYGSLAIIHEYSAIPTVSGPILTDLAGPLRFAKFSSPGSGDFDNDGDVDADDFARFGTCFTGANGGPIDPGCEPGDFDLDNDIDCDDWAQFGLVWTGPGQLPQLSQCSTASIPAVSQWGSSL